MFCLSKLPWMFCSFFTKLWFKMCNNRVKLRLSNKRLNVDQFYVSQANITALFFVFCFLFLFFFLLFFFSECVKNIFRKERKKNGCSMAWQIKTWNDNTPWLSCPGQITLSRDKLTKFAHYQTQTRSAQYQFTHQVWWKPIEIYSSYCPETKIRMCSGQITLPKLAKFAQKQSQSRSLSYQCTWQAPWKSIYN